jgi:hypothetical protein
MLVVHYKRGAIASLIDFPDKAGQVQRLVFAVREECSIFDNSGEDLPEE